MCGDVTPAVSIQPCSLTKTIMKLISLAFLSFVGALTASAQIVHWDHDDSGPYAAGNITLNKSNNNFAAPSGTSAVLNFSSATPAFTTGVGGYNGPTTYIGARLDTDVTLSPTGFYRVIYRAGEGMRYQFNNNSGGSTPTSVTYQAVTMWLQQDFLNGANSVNNLQFSATDYMSMKFSGAGEARFVVRDGDTYYISQATSAAAVEGLWTQSFTDGDGNWAVWDPTIVSFDAGSATFVAQDFSNITGVGFYARMQGAMTNFDLKDFQATAVPEPGTYALIFGSVVGLMVIRRRKRA